MTSNAESVMKNLAEVSREGERGFATAAQVVKDEKLRGILERASQRCAIGVRELEEAIVNSGGTVTDEGTISAALHRAWTNLKAAIARSDDRAVLDECERGEEFAKAAYQQALKQDLPLFARDLVDRQYKGVVENHDLIKRLRDAA
jgi:uncharacterized protein (TIGR02284 family)